MVSFFDEIDFHALRVGIKDNAWQRHVALGATVSPAALAKMKQDNELGCPFCSCSVATWEHMAWFCPQFENRPVKPQNPLTARFGWPTLNGDASVLKYLAKVAATVVECRYTDSHEVA